MKAIKSILKMFGLLLLLEAVLAGGLMVYVSIHKTEAIEKTDTFYLKDAEFDNPNYLNEMEELLKKESLRNVLHKNPTVFMHRIKQGKGLIIGYRWYSNGNPAIIDDERFKKITVWLPTSPQEGINVYDLSDSSKTVVAFTHGASAWPKKACSGYLTQGEIKIVSQNDNYSVTVDGHLKPEKNDMFKYLCNSKNIFIGFSAKEIAYGDLTPWLGKAGDHPYAETYR